MNFDRKLKFSVNPELVDKIQPSDKSFFSKGFELIEGTIEDLATVIQKDGWAFSYQFENNYRSKHNFMGSDIACIDIDGGLRISEALDDIFIKKYCSMMYTTASHTLEHHRFRLVFVLAKTVTKYDEIESISRSLARRFGGDMSATDGARMFYGSKDCTMQLFDNYIPDDVLIELIENGKTIPTKESIAHNKYTTTRSNHNLLPDTVVQTSDGKQAILKDIKIKTSIYCPFHADNNPSAFVSVNKNGSTYVHCKSCAMTWWMKSNLVPSYEFYKFEELVLDLVKKSKTTLKCLDSPLSEILCPITISPKNIKIVNEQFLDISSIDEGITFVKSYKGTGKTTYLSQALTKIIYPFATLESYEEATDFETELPFASSEKILLIGHRQALIRDMCNKLKLNCYLDDKSFKYGEVEERKKRYGVCLDSLEKVRNHQFNIVVIDEVEQVLNHFLSETVGEKRIKLFHLLAQIIQNAKKVVALDADLGVVSFATLTSLVHQAPQISVNCKKTNQSNQKPVHIIINTYHPKNKSINIYSSLNHLVQVAVQSLIDGKRIFITSNSKSKIDTLSESINKLLKDQCLTKSMLSITSENSKSEKVQNFIQNISAEILKYDAVLSSPSLGTGIDITFEKGAQEIDCVYGIFENQINSHFEIDQQLARVRNPKDVSVWISPSAHSFETNFGITLNDVLQDAIFDISEHGYINTDIKSFKDIDSFYIMAAMIVSYQRASKNNLKANFIEYKKRHGYDLKFIATDESLALEGKDIFNEGKYLKDKKYYNAILSSKVMNQVGHIQCKNKFRNNIQVSQDDLFSFIKTNIELFYGEPATTQLIELDNRKQFRSAIMSFESLMNTCDFNLHNNSSLNSALPPIHQVLLKNKDISKILLYNLFITTPLLVNNQFDLNMQITTSDLNQFIAQALKFKNEIFTQLGIQLRSDLSNNPVKLLSQILSKIGLKLTKTKAIVANKTKHYYYEIDMSQYNLVYSYYEKRKLNKSGWSYVNSAYGFKYDQTEQEYIDSESVY